MIAALLSVPRRDQGLFAAEGRPTIQDYMDAVRTCGQRMPAASAAMLAAAV